MSYNCLDYFASWASGKGTTERLFHPLAPASVGDLRYCNTRHENLYWA